MSVDLLCRKAKSARDVAVEIALSLSARNLLASWQIGEALGHDGEPSLYLELSGHRYLVTVEDDPYGDAR